MKIAYITMQFPVPSETFASLEVDQIRNYGNDIEIYCLRNKHKNYRELLNQRQHDGIYISNFRFSSLLRFVRFLFTNPIKCFLLFSWIFKCCYKTPIHLIKSIVLYPSAISIFMEIKEKNFDVVHLYWGHYTSLVGYLVNKYNSQTVLSMFLGAHDLRVNFPCSVYLHRQADCCFTQVKKNREILDLFGYDTDRFKVIYDGIIIDKAKKIDHNIDISNILFMSAGRIIKEKGIYENLDIFSKFNSLYPNSHYYIAGNGPDLSNLKNKVIDLGLSSSVTFLGHINQDLLFRYLQKSNFFLIMSYVDHLPNVIKEAMYQKCVVITSDTVGIDELIDNKKNGFILDIDNYMQSVDILIDLVNDKERYKSMVEHAHEVILEKFDIKKNVAKYIQSWEQAIKQ